MQVFVSGTWKKEKALAYCDQAVALGRTLADEGFDLACGPGTGVARHVIDGYRSRPGRGIVRYYLPLAVEMVKVGETVEPGSDEVEQTSFDYPMRNVYQVKQSDGLLVITGGDGTLEEILPAVIDYGLPVGILEGAGTAAKAMKALVGIYPQWNEQIVFGLTVQEILPRFFELLGRKVDRAARVEAPK